MAPVKTGFAGHDGWDDWSKWLAIAAVAGALYKIGTGRRVGLTEIVGLFIGFHGLFGQS